MKIVHLYAKNMQMFIDAVNGTDCRLNGSNDIAYLTRSLQLYNARDVLGLIVFANPMTKKCLNLVKAFDDMFMFKRLPIIIINDNATQLYEDGNFKIKNSDLYLIDSEENSISDIELRKIFVTLLGSASEIYDLSGCNLEKSKHKHDQLKSSDVLEMSDSLQSLLKTLDRGGTFEDSSRGRSHGAGGCSEEEENIGEEVLSTFEGED